MTVEVLLREGEGWRRERKGRNREERGEGEWRLGLRKEYRVLFSQLWRNFRVLASFFS